MPERRQLGGILAGEIIQFLSQDTENTVPCGINLTEVRGVSCRCFDHAAGAGIDDGGHTAGLGIKDVVQHGVSDWRLWVGGHAAIMHD